MFPISVTDNENNWKKAKPNTIKENPAKVDSTQSFKKSIWRELWFYLVFVCLEEIKTDMPQGKVPKYHYLKGDIDYSQES